MLDTTIPYLLTPEFRDRLMLEGEFTVIPMTHPQASGTGYANRTTFTFDSSTFDDNGDGTSDATLAGSMLFVTGIRIICEAGTQFGGLTFDARLLLDQAYLQNANGDDIQIDDLGQAFGTPATDENAANMKDAFGLYAIPIRNAIEIWVDAIGGGETLRAFFIGYEVDRKY